MTAPTRQPRPTGDQPTTGAAAIDLEAVKRSLGASENLPKACVEDIHNLIAEVEGLRKRVAGFEAETNELAKSDDKNFARAYAAHADLKAAQAREVELAGVLERARGLLAKLGYKERGSPVFQTICAVLASTPADALERVGATREYFKRIIQAIDRTTHSGEIRREHDEVKRLANEALAALDALAPEDGT